MPKLRFLILLAWIAGIGAIAPPPAYGQVKHFQRGDANIDGFRDISDAVFTLDALFVGVAQLQCEDAADANDDGSVNIGDPIYMLGSVFGSGPPPLTPVVCGADPTADAIDCQAYPGCPQPPFALFTCSAIAGEPPFTVDFDATTSFDPDGTVVSYAWDFGDGATDTGAVVSHEYDCFGEFTVTLTVTDNSGFTGQGSKPLASLPTVFTVSSAFVTLNQGASGFAQVHVSVLNQQGAGAVFATQLVGVINAAAPEAIAGETQPKIGSVENIGTP
ncbi:MAG: PKD domain-containing protein [Planctomycetota bacterium]